MKHLFLGAAGLLLCLSVFGCGSGGQGSVSGTVTLDGQPIPEGSIAFVKTEGGDFRGGAVIQNGEFETSLPPGKYRIEVTSEKVVGKRKQKDFDGKEEEVEITEQVIPERYNKKTELTEEIESGSNSLKLEFKSGK